MVRGYDVVAGDIVSKDQQQTKRYHYQLDEQFSTSFITNASGKVENRYTYDAFGNTLESQENVHNRIKYTGQQYDPVTEQYYLRARFYNPILGRFMQEDVYRGDGLNLYAYCDNNPVMYYDPSGYACDNKNDNLAKNTTEGSGQAKTNADSTNGTTEVVKRINVGDSGHHVPAVRKSKGRPFEVARSDKTRPTIFSKGSDPGYDHWRLHDAERNYVGPRQGDFIGTNDELFNAYRNAYQDLNDIKVDVKSPDGTYNLGSDVTPHQAIDLVQNWLKEQGLY